jgi:hypothetical protein
MTLTYRLPPASGAVAKAHLQAFKRRWLRWREGEELEAVWKMEFQRRGVIHWHVVVNNTDAGVEMADTRRWVALAWHQVLTSCRSTHNGPGGCADWPAFQAGTQADPMKVARDPSAYFIGGEWTSKSKEYQHTVPDGFKPGRWWGLWGWGEPEWLVARPTEDTARWENRLMRRALRHQTRPKIRAGHEIEDRAAARKTAWKRRRRVWRDTRYAQTLVVSPTQCAEDIARDLARGAEIAAAAPGAGLTLERGPGRGRHRRRNERTAEPGLPRRGHTGGRPAEAQMMWDLTGNSDVPKITVPDMPVSEEDAGAWTA